MADLADEEVDFAIAAFRDDEGWHAEALAPAAADDLPTLLRALRQLSGSGEVLGLVSVADDFFLLLRLGAGVRILLSDVSAATEWPIARAALDELGIPVPDEDDAEHAEPAGDLAIVSDLGLEAMELAALCADLDLYPDEVLTSIATRLGFGDQFERALDSVG
jgi:putative tRNA adenosine deaminase-associated protein